jgi:hypothetical protein
MKILLLFFGFLISAYFLSCNNMKNGVNQSGEIIKENLIHLKIKGNINSTLQIDSIFTKIETIPLETKRECLITTIEKVLFYEDLLLIHDKAEKLYVFNINGKYLYEIGKKGRGPGEYSELRDFDLDKNGNVFILDYLKIHKYNIDGKFITSLTFNYSTELCYPIQFALNSNDDFFIWGGSFGVRNNSEGKIFAMYELLDGKIINKYFPVKYNIVGNSRQFTRYDNLILIDPIFGSNIIYSINNRKVEERYIIDFGEKTLNIPIPEGFNSLSDFKSRIDNNYFHSIYGFIETKKWLYFKFVFRRHVYNVYFSKDLNIPFISTQWPLVSGRIAPWQISASYNNNFIGFVDPKYVLEQIKRCKELDYQSLPQVELESLKRLEQIKNTDNPVMFICTTKDY